MGVFYYDYFKQKRITAVVVSAFILIFVFVLATEKREMVPTVTLPVSGKTIILDAGHGKPDEWDKIWSFRELRLLFSKKTL